MSMKSFYTPQGVIQHENDSTGDHDRDYIIEHCSDPGGIPLIPGIPGIKGIFGIPSAPSIS